MKKINNILLVLSLSFLSISCINDDPIKLGFAGYQPTNLSDGWVISSPANENIDSDLLNMAYKLIYNEERFVMARSLLVLRNGKLVGEAYPHDQNDSHQLQNIQSCTKSVTSILAGIAFSRGLLDSLSQPLSDIFPEHFINYPDKRDITIEHALTMRAGIAFNDDDHTYDFYQASGSSVEFVLNLPKNYPAGTVFHYNDGVPQLISAAIQKRYGKSLSAFADEYLFKPLQITDWKWEAAKDGVTFGAVSLFMKPRDIAKVGQLLLNNGRWNGAQVVDSSWIAKATKPLVTSYSPGTSYGYYFWVYPAYPAYAAVGHGGQYIFIAPLKNLVIIYTAWPYTSGEMFDDFTEIADLIVKSCR
jgi:CubicO group peptidase (beta-lactamase class C family)